MNELENWQRNLQNEANQSYDRKPKTRSGNFFLIKEIEIKPFDQNRLREFMKSELNFYNNLAEKLHARMKTQPQTLVDLTDRQIELFGAVAETDFDIRTIINRSQVELPTQLKPFRDILLGKDINNKRKLTDTLLSILEIANMQSNMTPQMRRQMALGILKFYKEQSNFAIRVNKRRQDDSFENMQTYQSSFSFLETLEYAHKRHIQLINPIVDKTSPVKVVWDKENQRSLIYTPYTLSPIITPRMNLKEIHWKLMIIRQAGKAIPTAQTPWEIQLHNIFDDYLVKFQDSNNPFASTFNKKKNNNHKHHKKVQRKNEYDQTTKKWIAFA